MSNLEYFNVIFFCVSECMVILLMGVIYLSLSLIYVSSVTWTNFATEKDMYGLELFVDANFALKYLKSAWCASFGSYSSLNI